MSTSTNLFITLPQGQIRFELLNGRSRIYFFDNQIPQTIRVSEEDDDLQITIDSDCSPTIRLEGLILKQESAQRLFNTHFGLGLGQHTYFHTLTEVEEVLSITVYIDGEECDTICLRFVVG